MTLLRYDRFSFLPKRCGTCNRLFIWEQYSLKHGAMRGFRAAKVPVCKYCSPCATAIPRKRKSAPSEEVPNTDCPF